MKEKVIRLHVLNGPNLNLLGKREPEKYGATSLIQIYKNLLKTLVSKLKKRVKNGKELDLFLKETLAELIDYDAEDGFDFALPLSLCLDKSGKRELTIELYFYQTNSESALIDYLHNCYFSISKYLEQYKAVEDYFIINPAAFGHTSVALRDALLAVEAKFVEVHLSNIHKRETFRHHTYLQDIAQGVICGLGEKGYELALEFWLDYIYELKVF
ncbi:type II 3-dehydroquinate dehydratase [Psittacicella gerlachiana]|uniref:3-dehydroquinate dehydratase n=1 Tax=Psittacicella gerlachiana TaxID=2028574 RepID=A0A3A1YAE4_9GAMM|nr:type II 3-dehydroquinate dehydratase [Psittacicella gerlachiana]RIY34199.1 hypothetical protein CKF59_05815 [Psittacicella gerlachiana]